MTSYYKVEFYPNWRRGPRDQGYHMVIATLTDKFKTLPLAKKEAEHQMILHNSAVPENRWKAVIYKTTGNRMVKSVAGIETNGRVDWHRVH